MVKIPYTNAGFHALSHHYLHCVSPQEFVFVIFQQEMLQYVKKAPEGPLNRPLTPGCDVGNTNIE